MKVEVNFLIQKIYENPDIYNIHVPLPNNPLKNLNCYVIKALEKNLIIDTGFNMPECYKALKVGLEQLEIDINKTDMFITHMHSDHSGLVGEIMNENSTIYMSEIDNKYITEMADTYWVESDKTYLIEGFPKEDLVALSKLNPAKIYAPNIPFNVTTFRDNFKFKINKYEFTCIMTEGHTPGHACLYMENEKIMFLGDHVLFDITPNITNWWGIKDSLLDYLKSLKKIRNYDIKVALPSHRKNDMDVYIRIDELINHHDIRLKNTINIIELEEGLTANEIASKMKWSMHGKDWSEFPIQQKWFAVGETLAHLDYLIESNKIYKILNNEVYKYYLLNDN